MSAENIFTGARRRAWRALTDSQREQAAGLVLSVLSAALVGPSAVAERLEAAGRVCPGLEEHVVWAARQVGPLLWHHCDPDHVVADGVELGIARRSRDLEMGGHDREVLL